MRMRSCSAAPDPQGCCVMAQSVSERAGDRFRVRLGFEGGCSACELGGMVVGAGDVRARRAAPVEARAVGGVQSVAQGSVSVVDAHHEGVRVVVDGQLGVVEDVPGLPTGADGPGECRGLAGCPDGAAGCRPGDACACLEVGVEGSEGVRGGAGGLDVQEVVDAVAAAGCVASADGGAQVAVLDREGDQSSGAPYDVPGQRASERARPRSPCGSSGTLSCRRPS